MFERDEDGTLVIEISPTMRVVILAAVMIFAGMIVWWFSSGKEQAEAARQSRVPGDILPTDEFGPDNPDKLMGVEQDIGVSPYSLLTIERLAGADREELEKIFDEILDRGLPDLTSEEAQLYNGLISRSAEIAPNRSLRFYDMLEGGNQRAYSISQLYSKWSEIKPEEAVETAKLVEEPLRFKIMARDLPKLVDTKPIDALTQAVVTSKDYFKHVTPNFIRPVVRKWAKTSFSEAEKAVYALKDSDARHQAIQGLALAKLDAVANWNEAYRWAGKVKGSQERLWAQLTIAEMGVHKHWGALGQALNNFPHQSLKQHLLRLAEARRLVEAVPEQERANKAIKLYTSTDPYDYHGRLCIVNTFADDEQREREGIMVRTRWPMLGRVTFLADGYTLCGNVPPNIKQAPLVDLLERGQSALDKGDLKSSKRDFLKYLHYNPETDTVTPYLTEWSKAAGVWLGPGASKLDEVTVSANEVPVESDFFEVMAGLQEQFEATTGQALEMHIFEAISGIKPDLIWSWGKHGEVTVREALDVLSEFSGLTMIYHEYGIVGFYWRDEDIALTMGSPLELVPYPTY